MSRHRVKINTWTDEDKKGFPAWYAKFATTHGLPDDPQGQKYDSWTHYKSGAASDTVFPKYQTNGWCFVRESLEVLSEQPSVASVAEPPVAEEPAPEPELVVTVEDPAPKKRGRPKKA
tara:strand:- start:116 stop:469 length:354 start_codon:yes stop_codon:yes gene_type:complete